MWTAVVKLLQTVMTIYSQQINTREHTEEMRLDSTAGWL